MKRNGHLKQLFLVLLSNKIGSGLLLVVLLFSLLKKKGFSAVSKSKEESPGNSLRGNNPQTFNRMNVANGNDWKTGNKGKGSTDNK